LGEIRIHSLRLKFQCALGLHVVQRETPGIILRLEVRALANPTFSTRR
jgi:hypothetical protein